MEMIEETKQQTKEKNHKTKTGKTKQDRFKFMKVVLTGEL